MALVEGCKHSLEISIPVLDVENELGRVTSDVQKHAKLPGFRPGKAPITLVRRRFAEDIQGEVVQSLVPEYLEKALDEQKLVPVVPYSGGFPTTRAPPFLEANYKIEQNWSVYAQYATGIYVPDISAFENKTGVLSANNAPKAQTTTNYQFGTVYYADNWTFDGDLYYIGINNNIIYAACTATGQFAGPSGETCAVNSGVATYKGIEGEGTYAFDGMLDGMSVFASGSVNDAKSGGKYIPNAPLWTQATGILYKIDAFKFSMIDKIVGQQYSDTTNTQFYKLTSYNNMDIKASYSLENYDFTLGINNVLNQRNLLQVKINDSSPLGGANVYDVYNRPNSLDQYYYAPATSVQFSVTARF